MKTEELKEIISKGETSSVQFKLNVHNELSIAQEMIVFANTIEFLNDIQAEQFKVTIYRPQR